MFFAITREDDDPLAQTRISLGSPHGVDSFYLVFRGDPGEVVTLLEKALVVAKPKLLTGDYKDHRKKKDIREEL